MISIYAPAIRALAAIGLVGCLAGMVACVVWAVRRAGQ